MKIIGKWFSNLLGRISSIKKRIMVSYIIIIGLLIIPHLMTLYTSSTLMRRYNTLITNVSDANTLNSIVKSEIPNEIWDIVAGKKDFHEGKQYEIIRDINARLEALAQTASTDENARILRNVVARTMDTLEKYIDKLGEQIDAQAPVAENEDILDEVRAVNELVYETLAEFMMKEIQAAEAVNQTLQATLRNLMLFDVGIVVLAILLAIVTTASVSTSIQRPLLSLEALAARIAKGDWQARAQMPEVQELFNLTSSLNTMAGKIEELINANIQEQQNLQKSEMKVLQAQITPHFLYNTFDTIVWLAESGRNVEVISITRAFSTFFRISLSKGKDWITVEQEVAHVVSYLTIQKIRYSDILDFAVDVQPEMLHQPMLKLLLQPLVENALYHGIKNRRGRGRIDVRGWIDDNFMRFAISDNGVGLTAKRLGQIRAQLKSGEQTETGESGYGLYNVDKRLRLYYEICEGLDIQSEYHKGTIVSFSVPFRKENSVV